MQHFYLEKNLVLHEYHRNLQTTKCPNSTPNIVFPISLNLEQPQASEEEITSCGISHDPLHLLHNMILVINGSDDEKVVMVNGLQKMVCSVVLSLNIILSFYRTAVIFFGVLRAIHFPQM